MGMNYDIFISYAHADAATPGWRNAVNLIKEVLENDSGIIAAAGHPVRVFLDAKDLPRGGFWYNRIVDAISTSKAFICLVSTNYMRSAACTRERLAWYWKYTRNGTLGRENFFPIYYLNIEEGAFGFECFKRIPDVVDVQMDAQPWFEALRQSIIERFESNDQDVQDGCREFIRQKLFPELYNDSCENGRHSLLMNAVGTRTDGGGGFCSIPEINPKFVGRIRELRLLHACCNRKRGCYPILHAQGGEGKTELAYAYAHGYSDDYPGGQFLVRMTGMRTWEDAICSLADGINAVGVSAGEWLLTPDERKAEHDKTKYVRLLMGKIRKLSRERGRVLLVLDNLENIGLLEDAEIREALYGGALSRDDGIDILATTRCGVTKRHFDIDASAVISCECAFADSRCETQCAVGIKVGPLSNSDGMELLRLIFPSSSLFYQNRGDENSQDLLAANELLSLCEGHAWSIEIVAGYMAENEGVISFSEKVAELKRDFLISSDWPTFRHNPKCSELLLQPTLDAIQKMGSVGARAIELLEVATFFSPDAIPRRLLSRYHYEELVSVNVNDVPEQINSLESRSLGVLEQFHLILPSDVFTYRMHVNTFAVIERRTHRNSIIAAHIAKELMAFRYLAFSVSEMREILRMGQKVLLDGVEKSFLDFWLLGLLEICCDQGEKLQGGFRSDFVDYVDFAEALIRKNELAKRIIASHERLAVFRILTQDTMSFKEQLSFMSACKACKAVCLSLLPDETVDRLMHWRENPDLSALDEKEKSIIVIMARYSLMMGDCAWALYGETKNFRDCERDDEQDFLKSILDDGHDSHHLAYTALDQIKSDPILFGFAATSLLGWLKEKVQDGELRKRWIEHITSKALQSLDGVVGAAKCLARIYDRFGSVMSLVGENDVAIEAHEAAVSWAKQCCPDFNSRMWCAYLWDHLGVAYARSGKVDDALTSYRSYLEVLDNSTISPNPSKGEAHEKIGGALMRKGEYVDAANELKLARSIYACCAAFTNQYVDASLRMMDAYTHAQQYEDVISIGEEVVGFYIDSHRLDFRYKLAQCEQFLGYAYCMVGNSERALEFIGLARDELLSNQTVSDVVKIKAYLDMGDALAFTDMKNYREAGRLYELAFFSILELHEKNKDGDGKPDETEVDFLRDVMRGIRICHENGVRLDKIEKWSNGNQ